MIEEMPKREGSEAGECRLMKGTGTIIEKVNGDAMTPDAAHAIERDRRTIKCVT